MCTEHKMCALCFTTKFVRNIFRSNKYLASYFRGVSKINVGIHIKRPLLHLIGIKVGIFEQNLVTYKILNLVKIRSAALSIKEGKDMNDRAKRRNTCNFSLRKKYRL